MKNKQQTGSGHHRELGSFIPGSRQPTPAVKSGRLCYVALQASVPWLVPSRQTLDSVQSPASHANSITLRHSTENSARSFFIFLPLSFGWNLMWWIVGPILSLSSFPQKQVARFQQHLKQTANRPVLAHPETLSPTSQGNLVLNSESICFAQKACGFARQKAGA